MGKIWMWFEVSCGIWDRRGGYGVSVHSEDMIDWMNRNG